MKAMTNNNQKKRRLPWATLNYSKTQWCPGHGIQKQWCWTILDDTSRATTDATQDNNGGSENTTISKGRASSAAKGPRYHSKGQQGSNTSTDMWTKLTHGRDEAKNNQRMGRKPKGLLQVLWGQGWIDVMKLNHYTMDGMQNAFGVVSKKFSLKTIMDSCLDFKQEETLLQSMGWSMGALVDKMPKCHCEVVEEGIKYSWGCRKNMYQWVTLSKKKGKEISDAWCR